MGRMINNYVKLILYENNLLWKDSKKIRVKKFVIISVTRIENLKTIKYQIFLKKH